MAIITQMKIKGIVMALIWAIKDGADRTDFLNLDLEVREQTEAEANASAQALQIVKLKAEAKAFADLLQAQLLAQAESLFHPSFLRGGLSACVLGDLRDSASYKFVESKGELPLPYRFLIGRIALYLQADGRIIKG